MDASSSDADNDKDHLITKADPSLGVHKFKVRTFGTSFWHSLLPMFSSALCRAPKHTLLIAVPKPHNFFESSIVSFNTNERD